MNADPLPSPPLPDRAAQWVYQGVWAILVRWLRVPAGPPSLPLRNDGADRLQQFRPAPAFLAYLKFYFWLVVIVKDVPIFIGCAIFAIFFPIVGSILGLIIILIAITPDILGFIALHVRYDSTWYVMTDRSLRIRRGIWIIRESTITFENAQNVTVNQGPLQRYFKIADVVVETAGAAPSGGGGGHHQHTAENEARIEGVSNAAEIRDLILTRIRPSQSAGLGDEAHPHDHPSASHPTAPTWTPAHLALLRDIRDELAA